ncbi:HoxN/HupN/NixA family nickel/cobalt transporter [Desulfurella sp.]|uniref:HoxN/HupN/NixA family nickel/cobalt transporter n=1 Tax=Desulfurella sp. TaxID=1962857 RepID=UPI0025C0B4A2|nr:HoxN/HupN/NixA family nickel/cobalt transporter [Desulfurella sp.]
MSLKSRTFVLFAFIIIFNLSAWGAFFYLVKLNPILSSLGLLAYFFGLKHAFDADHIAAIDNVTRKLRQDDQKPVGVGLFFSLGHSTVVILLSFGLIIAARTIQTHMDFLKNFGNIFGTVVSALFLTIIGILNLLVVKSLYDLSKEYRKGNIKHEEIDDLLNKRGLMGRFFGFLYKKINKSYQMYPVGFLFGLGFDTATEVAVLGISAALAKNSHMPIWSILVFPFLFTAGMSLMDSLDGLAMMKVYDWAMNDVIRKLFFNIFVTGASVFVALFVGTIEWIQVLSSELNLTSPFFVFVQNIPFSELGLSIVGFLILSWVSAYIYYKKALAKIKLN